MWCLGGLIDGGEETGYCVAELMYLPGFEPVVGTAGGPHHLFFGRNPDRVGL